MVTGQFCVGAKQDGFKLRKVQGRRGQLAVPPPELRALVQDQLAQIEEPRLRETFLNNVPVNRVLRRLVASG